MTARPGIGFIGVGMMGEPMCRNLVAKSGADVTAFDLAPEPLARLEADGARIAGSAAEAARAGEVVFLCLPSGRHVEAAVEGKEGLLAQARPGQVVVDLGTSPVALERDLAQRLAARGAAFADAPIARTREAARKGTLSVMVGAEPEVFARIEPLLRCVATDITHCGGVGTGQVAKILNNMVLFETVHALAEALAVGRRAGIAPALLFEVLSKGSADSFALRNHGMKAMLPGAFPERAFSAEYALKDLSYALALASETGLELRGAALVGDRLREAIEAGDGGKYWPVIARLIDRE
jgi:3-hydroxyisobutyrate dehydrogenase-like beta-hydroxyacid dehydrogenase